MTAEEIRENIETLRGEGKLPEVKYVDEDGIGVLYRKIKKSIKEIKNQWDDNWVKKEEEINSTMKNMTTEFNIMKFSIPKGYDAQVKKTAMIKPSIPGLNQDENQQYDFGTSEYFARGDHRHPSDTSKQNCLHFYDKKEFETDEDDNIIYDENEVAQVSSEYHHITQDVYRIGQFDQPIEEEVLSLYDKEQADERFARSYYAIDEEIDKLFHPDNIGSSTISIILNYATDRDILSILNNAQGDEGGSE